MLNLVQKAAAAVLVSGSLLASVSADAAGISQRQQLQQAQRAFTASTTQHNEVAASAGRMQHAAETVRKTAVRVEKFLWSIR